MRRGVGSGLRLRGFSTERRLGHGFFSFLPFTFFGFSFGFDLRLLSFYGCME